MLQGGRKADALRHEGRMRMLHQRGRGRFGIAGTPALRSPHFLLRPPILGRNWGPTVSGPSLPSRLGSSWVRRAPPLGGRAGVDHQQRALGALQEALGDGSEGDWSAVRLPRRRERQEVRLLVVESLKQGLRRIPPQKEGFEGPSMLE